MRRRGWQATVAVLAVLAFATGAGAAPGDAAPVDGPPRGRPLAGPQLLVRTQEVSSLLRCPVCQGLSVADSPSAMARSMKTQVQAMLAAGYDEEQVLAYFERSYGEFVLLRPRLHGLNWLVWLAPVLALLAGGAAIRRALGGRRGTTAPALPAGADPPEADGPGPDTLPDDARLAACVLRVRELAYGWPGGRSPSASAAADPPSPRQS